MPGSGRVGIKLEDELWPHIRVVLWSRITNGKVRLSMPARLFVLAQRPHLHRYAGRLDPGDIGLREMPCAWCANVVVPCLRGYMAKKKDWMKTAS